jgi:hypothetical protein
LDGAQVEDSFSTNRELQITFTPPIKDIDQLVIPFRTRLYANTHSFRSYLFSPDSENPLNVSEHVTVGSWTVVTDDVLDRLLSKVSAVPRVFSPDGDGICDYTVIEFILAKVREPREIEIKIFDLKGILVRDLGGGRLLSASAYLHPGMGDLGSYAADRLWEIAPGYWDGTDEEGDRVPPGIYLYQVKACVDEGEEIRGGTVTVAY